MKWTRHGWGWQATFRQRHDGTDCIVQWSVMPLPREADDDGDGRWFSAVRQSMPQTRATGTSYTFGPLADGRTARAFAEDAEGRGWFPADALMAWNLPVDEDTAGAGVTPGREPLLNRRPGTADFDAVSLGGTMLGGVVVGAAGAGRRKRDKDVSTRLDAQERALLQEFMRAVVVTIGAAVDAVYGPQVTYTTELKQGAGHVLARLVDRGLIHYRGDGRWELGNTLVREQLEALVAGFGAAPKSPTSRCISKKMRGEGWEQPRAVAACLNMDRAGRLGPRGGYHKVRRKA